VIQRVYVMLWAVISRAAALFCLVQLSREPTSLFLFWVTVLYVLGGDCWVVEVARTTASEKEVKK